MISWIALGVFVLFFLVVTVLGLVAARGRRGDLNRLDEWGLAGRRFALPSSVDGVWERRR